VNNNTPNSHAPTITARPSVDEKRRFVELAAQRGVSESTLALMAIRMLLGVNVSPTGYRSDREDSVALDRSNHDPAPTRRPDRPQSTRRGTRRAAFEVRGRARPRAR